MNNIDVSKIDYYIRIRDLANQNNNDDCWEKCDQIIRRLSYQQDIQDLVDYLRAKHCEYVI